MTVWLSRCDVYDSIELTTTHFKLVNAETMALEQSKFFMVYYLFVPFNGNLDHMVRELLSGRISGPPSKYSFSLALISRAPRNNTLCYYSITIKDWNFQHLNPTALPYS